MDPTYLDANATTPVEPEVVDLMIHFFRAQYGNAGSRTHEYGRTAASAVVRAREQVARVVASDPDDIYFTSGATEANNLALLGLEAHGAETSRRHIVANPIEHKAVLEPLQRLQSAGFIVDWVAPGSNGIVSAQDVLSRVRPDTLLVTLMHANNETGVLQPIAEVADGLQDHPAYLHVDAAQSFGKELTPLRHRRIDLLSASAHKVYGPKGVGCLVVRKRGYRRVPLRPLMVGGGQERGLRPGTLPVPLVAGFGLACELAIKNADSRRERNLSTRAKLFGALIATDYALNGAEGNMLPHVANLRFEGVDSEALMLTVKEHLAFSNGAACTSHSYQKSHVLKAMGLTDSQIASSIRLSWSHHTPAVDFSPLAAAVTTLRRTMAA